MRLLKMKKYLLAAVALAALIVSCSSPVKEPSAVVSGRMIGNDVETLYLVKATDGLDNSEMVDSVRLDENGCFRFELSQTDSSPRFYKLVYAGGRPVTLLIGDGDRITVDSAGDIFHNYTIEGSDESELIRQFNREYYGGYDRLLSLADMASHASSSEAAALNKQIYRTIVETIQAQVRFVGAHADRLASVYAMRQTLPAPFAEAFAGEGITNAHRNTVSRRSAAATPPRPISTCCAQTWRPSRPWPGVVGQDHFTKTFLRSSCPTSTAPGTSSRRCAARSYCSTSGLPGWATPTR